jgi:hypothetical protein
VSDLYPRPSREAIAAQVSAQQPPATQPEEARNAGANFAVNLAARMRAQGLTHGQVAEKSGTGNAAVSYALGTGSRQVGLDAAAKIAAVVGSDLAAMIRPYTCATCKGKPPKGFSCLECGAEARAA